MHESILEAGNNQAFLLAGEKTSPSGKAVDMTRMVR
jgi:hypothetical protein